MNPNPGTDIVLDLIPTDQLQEMTLKADDIYKSDFSSSPDLERK